MNSDRDCSSSDPVGSHASWPVLGTDNSQARRSPEGAATIVVIEACDERQPVAEARQDGRLDLSKQSSNEPFKCCASFCSSSGPPEVVCDICQGYFHLSCGFDTSEGTWSSLLTAQRASKVQRWCGCEIDQGINAEVANEEVPAPTTTAENLDSTLPSNETLQQSSHVVASESHDSLAALPGEQQEGHQQQLRPAWTAEEDRATVQQNEGANGQTQHRFRALGRARTVAERRKILISEWDKIQKSMTVIYRRLGIDMAVVGIGDSGGSSECDTIWKLATPGLAPLISDQWLDPENTLPAVRQQTQVNTAMKENRIAVDLGDKLEFSNLPSGAQIHLLNALLLTALPSPRQAPYAKTSTCDLRNMIHPMHGSCDWYPEGAAYTQVSKMPDTDRIIVFKALAKRAQQHAPLRLALQNTIEADIAWDNSMAAIYTMVLNREIRQTHLANQGAEQPMPINSHQLSAPRSDTHTVNGNAHDGLQHIVPQGTKAILKEIVWQINWTTQLSSKNSNMSPETRLKLAKLLARTDFWKNPATGRRLVYQYNQVAEMIAVLPDPVQRFVNDTAARSTSRGKVTTQAKLMAIVSVLASIHAKMHEEATEDLDASARDNPEIMSFDMEMDDVPAFNLDDCANHVCRKLVSALTFHDDGMPSILGKEFHIHGLRLEAHFLNMSEALLSGADVPDSEVPPEFKPMRRGESKKARHYEWTVCVKAHMLILPHPGLLAWRKALSQWQLDSLCEEPS